MDAATRHFRYAGETSSDLAREFGILPQRVSQIVRGKRK